MLQPPSQLPQPQSENKCPDCVSLALEAIPVRAETVDVEPANVEQFEFPVTLQFDEQWESLLEGRVSAGIWYLAPRLRGSETVLSANSRITLLFGIASGIVSGLGAAIALEKWRDIFYTSDDIQDALLPPILGEIPSQKGLVMPSNSLAVSEMALERSESVLDPQFLDAFDVLYANIRFLYADAPIRSLTIGSTDPGDGKSAIALYLARTVANMGQRVLLVDANLRQPQLHTHLGISNHKGLSELLTDKLVPYTLVEPSPFADNLFVLNAGNPSAKAIKLLGSAQMLHIAEEFQATFDLVIYDTPAFGDVMDAIFLTAQTDGVLMVVGVKKTRQSNTLKTLDQLKVLRLPCLGIIANHTQARTSRDIPPEFHNSSVEFGEQTPWETLSDESERERQEKM